MALGLGSAEDGKWHETLPRSALHATDLQEGGNFITFIFLFVAMVVFCARSLSVNDKLCTTPFVWDCDFVCRQGLCPESIHCRPWWGIQPVLFFFRYTLWVHYGRVRYIMVLMLGYTMLDYGVNTVYSHESSECHDYKIYIYNVYILCRPSTHPLCDTTDEAWATGCIHQTHFAIFTTVAVFWKAYDHAQEKARQWISGQEPNPTVLFAVFYCFPACTGRHSRPFCRCSESCGTFDDWTELSHSGSLPCHIEKLGRRGLEYAFTAFWGTEWKDTDSRHQECHT